MYAISEPARLELLANLARAETDFGPAVRWHLRPRSLPDVITSAPIARAAIRCLAQLASTLERAQDGHLVQVMASSPQSRAESLPWGHYEGRWRRDEDEEYHASEARFAVHVDRDRLPPARAPGVGAELALAGGPGAAATAIRALRTGAGHL